MRAAVVEEKAAKPMTIQVIRNKTEQALVEQFASIEAALPGGSRVKKLRKEAIGAFAAMGLPHRRIEEWKYTDLRNMLKDPPRPASDEARVTAAKVDAALASLAEVDAVRLTFVDGRFVPSLSNVKELPREVHFKPLSEALAAEYDWLLDHMSADIARGAVPALNTAFATDGVTLRVEDGHALKRPIMFVFARSGSEPAAVTTRNAIAFGKGSSGVVLEAFVALDGAAETAQCNTLTSISVGDEAAVTHVKLAAGQGRDVHLSSLLASVGADASYRPYQMTVGTALTRNDIEMTYRGKGAKLDLSGLLLGRKNEHIDTTLVVDHAVPGCESRELFKAVLDDTARGVFQGKVIVRPDAQKTDGKQMAQALMLSPDAEFDSKPELEIYADDVVCGHGSTAADLDEELVFYCRSRGIPLKEARALLIESFIGEGLDRVEHDGIREALATIAAGWLRGAAQ